MGKRLHIYICGSVGSWDEYNSFYVASKKYAKEVMYLIAKKPMSIEELSAALNVDAGSLKEIVDALIKIDAAVVENNKVKANFVVFFREDIYKISNFAEKYSRELSEKIIEKWSTIERKLSEVRCVEQVGLKKVAFVVIGAYALDLDALSTLREKGLAIFKEPKPGNREYILYGREYFEEHIKLISGLYWGCHSTIVNGVGFYTFGDHAGRRYAIPDVNFSEKILGEFKSEDERKFRLRASELLIKVFKEKKCSKETLVETSTDSKILDLLLDMSYLKEENTALFLNYPVILEEDNENIVASVDSVEPTVEEVAVESYQALERKLRDITPLKEGFSPKLIFTEVWHWIFGKANKILATKGYIYDPLKRKPSEGKYIAWIHVNPPPRFM